MSIFKSRDYKQVILELISSRPKKGYGEVSRLAETLGVNTTMISQVLRGSKDFTFEQAQEIAVYFALDQLESDYLIHLVLYARANSPAARAYWSDKLEGIRERSLLLENRISVETRLSEEDRAEFYSNWQYSALRLSCEIPELGDAEALGRAFGLSKKRAVEILDFLVSRGLCVRTNDAKAGRYKMGPSRTHIEKGSPHLARHHLNWRLKAMQKTDSLEESDLMITSPMSMSREDFTTAREELVRCFNTIINRLVASKSETLACFNLDFIRLF